MSTETSVFDFSLSGKTAVVTGAASGIGLAIAEAFYAKGALVAFLDIDLDKAKESASKYDGSIALSCNVAEEQSVHKATEQIIAEFGCIDILVNSAGIVDLAPATDLSLSSWKRTLDINLTGTFLMSQSAGRVMIEQGSGKIINLASQAASVAIDEHAAYCASKFGVIGLTKTLALEWGKYGITVNSISPTVVLTELGKKAWAGEKGDAMREQIPSGRFAEPYEIAAAAIFLSSGGANMINGADLLIDGGFTVK